jgi:hypothetical protein
MQRALNSYFEQGGLSSDAIRVRIIITDSESNIAGTAITPRENGQIDLEQYSPQHEEIIARRMGPLPPSDS